MNIITALIITGALILIGFLLVRSAYVFLLYGFSLGFPDLAMSVGSINARLDDAIIILLFLRLLIVLRTNVITTQQMPIVKAYLSFWGYCILSACFVLVFGMDISTYDLIRMIGGGLTFIALVMTVQNRKAYRYLLYGIALGGMALCFQVFQHFHEISIYEITKSATFKSELNFSTWNPNTIGQACLMLSFSAGLGWAGSAGHRTFTRYIWMVLAIFFAIVPMFAFARGSSVAIVVGWLIILFMFRSYKTIVAIASLASLTAIKVYQSYGHIIDSAIDIDVSTGKGFSGRYELWGSALNTISHSPIWGHGFGRESFAFIDTIGHGMSHNAFLSVTVELGIVGLFIMLLIILRIYKAIYLKAIILNIPGYVILFGFITAICIDSIPESGLYWNKPITVAMAILSVSLEKQYKW